MTQYRAEDPKNIGYANGESLVCTGSPSETVLFYQWDSAEFQWKQVFRKCSSYQIDSTEGTCTYDWRMLSWRTLYQAKSSDSWIYLSGNNTYHGSRYNKCIHWGLMARNHICDFYITNIYCSLCHIICIYSMWYSSHALRCDIRMQIKINDTVINKKCICKSVAFDIVHPSQWTIIGGVWKNPGRAPNVQPAICTVYPKKYAHGFVVLCFAVVM